MSLLNVIFIFVLTATPVALILLLVKVIVNLRDTVYDLQDTIESLQSAVPIYHTTKLERLFDYAEKLQADKRNPFYTREIDFENWKWKQGLSEMILSPCQLQSSLKNGTK